MHPLNRFKIFDPTTWFLIGSILLCIIFVPDFAKMSTLKNILGQVCVLITVACGVHFTVLNGGTDFSCTSVIALSAILGASIMSETTGYFAGKWYAIPIAIVIMLGVGLVFGIINGLSIIMFKMPSFIVTMSTQMIGLGLAIMITEGQTIGGIPDSFTRLGTGHIGFFPYTGIFVLLIVIATSLILNKTIIGRKIYAVGTNPQASNISGISIRKTIFILYLISGLCAAFASIIMVAQMESAASSFGNNMFIDIMTSVIVGGANPGGGRGKIMGTVKGASIVILINVSMNMLGVKWFIISIIKGLIILIIAGVEIFGKSKVSLSRKTAKS